MDYSGPVFDANLIGGYPQLYELRPNFSNQRGRAADETQRRAGLDQAVQTRNVDTSLAASPPLACGPRDRMTEVDAALIGELLKLVHIRELLRRAHAVDQRRVPAAFGEQRVPEHRAQRRYPGAAGNEQKTALTRMGRKRERSDWPVDRDRCARADEIRRQP